MLQVLNNTFIKPVENYLNKPVKNYLNLEEVTFKDFDGQWTDYEKVPEITKWEGYFDKNGQLRSKKSLTDEYEKSRYDADFIRKNKIHNFIEENKLEKIECPFIQGDYYATINNDLIYKIDWTFYEKLEDILDHSNLFELINDEQTKQSLIKTANEYKKNTKLFKESMKDIDEGVRREYVIRNKIISYKKEKNKNCIIC